MIGSDSQFGAEIRDLVRCVSTNCQFVQVDENAGREKDLIYLILGMGWIFATQMSNNSRVPRVGLTHTHMAIRLVILG